MMTAATATVATTGSALVPPVSMSETTLAKYFFWVFAGIELVLFYYAMRYARKYPKYPAFLFPPFICICLMFDNIVMATTGPDDSKQSVQVMMVFRAFVLPLLLVDCFEIAYLVHKQKSVNFCGIAFESGHRAKHKQTLSTCLRFAVWLIGIALFVLNLFAAFYWQHKTSELQSFYHWSDDYMTHTMFCLVPTLVLVVLSFYIGLQLWNYGTFYSYMVHAMAFNPWIWMLVGSLALLAGYLMPSSLYPVTSNGGEMVMMASIIRMFREVHHDIQQGVQFRNFIDPMPFPIPMDYHPTHNGVAVAHHPAVNQPIGAASRDRLQQPVVSALTDLDNVSLPSKQVQKNNHVDLMETKDNTQLAQSYRAMFSPKHDASRHASSSHTNALYRRASEGTCLHHNVAISFNHQHHNNSNASGNNNNNNNYNLEHHSNKNAADTEKEGATVCIMKPSPKSDHINNNNNHEADGIDQQGGGVSSLVSHRAPAIQSPQTRINPLFTLVSRTGTADQL